MSGKKVSLSGEIHISTGSVYTTVDALEALKCIGLVYGLYDHCEDLRNCRVTMEGGDIPALVVQKDISHHGTPLWETVRMVTNDPEQIKRYMAFRNTVQMIRKLDIEQARESRNETPPKKREAKDRER
ncbi:hypothetical protein [uncultured Oscillibacter sp.]|uniref:hypothetical protein n=1 Tax=uncultured Oscillibacter sp. TaxID=876091 RepID=UPI002624DD13|nr:hypothetical protein [uncultured Oscillibacter sp.]